MNEKPIIVVLRGVVVAALFVALWVWLASFVRRYDSRIGVMLPVWLEPVGWILAATGGILAASCVVLFLTKGRGTPAPFDPPMTFVAGGPYRYVRNPMYIGAIMTLVGAGLIVRSPSIIVLGAIFWSLSHCLVLLIEEPDLTKRFGDAFAQYKREVNRWIPRF